MDADEHSVRFRYRELNNELEANGLAHRQGDENVCLQIPKRNIETWIYALFGQDVNEEEVYPYLDEESECQPAVEQLVEFLHDGWPNDLIPSLKRGCQELENRLPE